MIESSGQISVAIDNDAQLPIQGSTGHGHCFASLPNCLANSQSAIQLLIYIHGCNVYFYYLHHVNVLDLGLKNVIC